jgi:hypothetical protein
MESLKEKFKDEKQKIRFSTFMAFMFRLLSAKLDIKNFEKAKYLDEVIRMTYTFIDREIDKGKKEGRKEGEFNTVYNFIKQGLVTKNKPPSQ